MIELIASLDSLLPLHKDVWHAVAIQVQERCRVRCGHEVVPPRHLAGRILLWLHKEGLEVPVREFLANSVVRNQHLDVAVLGVVDDVGAAICQVIEYLHEVAVDVEERRLAPCRDLELTLTAEGLGLLNERIDLGRSLENLYKSVPITIVVDDEEILE